MPCRKVETVCQTKTLEKNCEFAKLVEKKIFEVVFSLRLKRAV